MALLCVVWWLDLCDARRQSSHPAPVPHCPVRNGSTEGDTSIAVVLRGEAFRNWGSNAMRGTCCKGSQPVQRRIAQLHVSMIRTMARRKMSVDVFIATYNCTNGLPLASMLLAWYKPWLRASAIIGRSSQGATIQRGLELVGSHGRPRGYSHLFVLRLDSGFVFHPCILSSGRVLNGGALCMVDKDGDDRFWYAPRAWIPCFVNMRSQMGTYMHYPDLVLGATGFPSPTARESLTPSTCRLRLSYEKLTAQNYWTHDRRGTHDEIQAAGCADVSLLTKTDGFWTAERQQQVLRRQVEQMALALGPAERRACLPAISKYFKEHNATGTRVTVPG